MIGRLRGILVKRRPPHLLVDCHGVGYELEAPMGTFYVLPAAGEEVLLHTHLVVREDAQQLFGFATEAERDLFRELIKVSGVGGRLALAVLSGMPASDFARCVHDNDVAALTRLPGVGKKTAERLIMEMRDRFKEPVAGKVSTVTLPGEAATPGTDPVKDAVSALIALGYKPQEASRMAQQVAQEDDDCEGIIRRALRAAAR